MAKILVEFTYDETKRKVEEKIIKNSMGLNERVLDFKKIGTDLVYGFSLSSRHSKDDEAVYEAKIIEQKNYNNDNNEDSIKLEKIKKILEEK